MSTEDTPLPIQTLDELAQEHDDLSVTYIELEKKDQGLGFSILDSQVKSCICG